jgi:hypothetical protein
VLGRYVVGGVIGHLGLEDLPVEDVLRDLLLGSARSARTVKPSGLRRRSRHDEIRASVAGPVGDDEEAGLERVMVGAWPAARHVALGGGENDRVHGPGEEHALGRTSSKVRVAIGSISFPSPLRGGVRGGGGATG